MPCVALSYETQQAILLIPCDILQNMPVPCVTMTEPMFFFFIPYFLPEYVPWWQREADTEMWGANINHLISPCYQDLVITNTPKGKCHNFFLCVISNFPFWVMQWSFPGAVLFPWPALGILDTYKVHCVSLFFFSSPILWHLTWCSGFSQKKGQTQKQHFPMPQLCHDGKRNTGKASQQVWRVRLYRSPHQTLLRAYLCDQHQ